MKCSALSLHSDRRPGTKSRDISHAMLATKIHSRSSVVFLNYQAEVEENEILIKRPGTETFENLRANVNMPLCHS